METIEMMLRAIKEMKSRIVRLDNDPTVHFNDKYERLAEMRSALVRAQATTVILMDEHLDQLKREAA